jgi:uncharacterized protein involved in exopolysaccharide biosynthesis
MKRYVEMFFRHKIALILPIILSLGAAGGYAVKAPRSYQSAATMWADASLPNASTLQAQTPAGQSTPSQIEAAVLEEFLHTLEFDMDVAKRTSLAHYVETQPAPEADEAAYQLAGTISITSPGPQIMSIGATEKSATLAGAAANAVVDEFLDHVTFALQSRDQSLVAYYKGQVATSTAALNAAEAQLGAYLLTHPVSATQTDSQANQLSGQISYLQQQQANYQANYDQAELDLAHAGDPNALHVIDAPQTPVRPLGRKKTLLLAGVAGLVIGLIVSLVILIFMVVQDRVVRDAADLDPLQLAVVGTIGNLPKGTLPDDRRRKRKGAAA